jgi:hypothetical protein
MYGEWEWGDFSFVLGTIQNYMEFFLIKYNVLRIKKIVTEFMETPSKVR